MSNLPPTTLKPDTAAEALRTYAGRFADGTTKRWDLAAHLMEEAARIIELAERQRDELAEAVGKLGLEELAHGWHASGAYDKHPDELGVKLPSNCGTVYAIVSALRSARNAMGEPNDKT